MDREEKREEFFRAKVEYPLLFVMMGQNGSAWRVDFFEKTRLL